MDIVNREDAMTRGLKHYFTGIKCSNDHVDVRFVSDRSCKSCRRESSIKWVNLNRERAREIWRACAKRRQPKRSQYALEWAKKNKDKVRLNDRIQKQKRRATGSLKRADILNILAIQKWKCAEPKCKKDLKAGFHLDHILPVKLGGKTERKNCQALCPRCNQVKSAKHPVDFANGRGRLL